MSRKHRSASYFTNLLNIPLRCRQKLKLALYDQCYYLKRKNAVHILKLFQAVVNSQIVLCLSLTLLVSVFNIGTTGNQHRHELLVPSCTRQGQRSVVITFSLHAEERKRSRYSEIKNEDNFNISTTARDFFFFFLSELIRKQILSKLWWMTHMCIDVHGWVHGQHGLRGDVARGLRAGLGHRGLGSVRGAAGAAGHSAIHS